MDARWVNQIPIKITAVKKREIRLDLKRILGLLVFTSLEVTIVLISVRISHDYGTVWITVLCILLAILLSLINIRLSLMLFFDEAKMYEDYKRETESRIFPINDFWDTLNISDEGVMLISDKVTGGHVRAVVVKLERSSTIGRPDSSEIEHYRGVTQFIRKLIGQNFMVRKYNLAVSDSNDEPLNEIERSLVDLNNNKLKNTLSSIIKYNRDSVRNLQNRTIEYYCVTSTGSASNLLSTVRESLGILRAHTIYKPEICNEKLVIQFLYDFFKLKYMDTKKAMLNNLPKESLINVEEVTYKNLHEEVFKPIETTADANIAKFQRMMDELERKKAKE